MDRGKDLPVRKRMTLAERKQQTRRALIWSGLDTFTRVGYHAASLDAIAADAGYSKGAIYSNFDGKAELFLAVMDHNLEVLQDAGWEPFAGAGESQPEPEAPARVSQEEAAELVRGFGLATLEFIATAARDVGLTDALRQRVQVMIDQYQLIAAKDRPAAEQLPVEDVAALMVALDQGLSVLSLSGITSVDGTLGRLGMQRLVDPARAATTPIVTARTEPAPLPNVEYVRRLLAEADEEATGG